MLLQKKELEYRPSNPTWYWYRHVSRVKTTQNGIDTPQPPSFFRTFDQRNFWIKENLLKKGVHELRMLTASITLKQPKCDVDVGKTLEKRDLARLWQGKLLHDSVLNDFIQELANYLLDLSIVEKFERKNKGTIRKVLVEDATYWNFVAENVRESGIYADLNDDEFNKVADEDEFYDVVLSLAESKGQKAALDRTFTIENMRNYLKRKLPTAAKDLDHCALVLNSHWGHHTGELNDAIF